MSKRKLLLAKVRNGNYAHAGEEAAIEIAMNFIPKNPKQLLLDVGCGLGGTAEYVKQHGWGDVVGIDIDPNMIAQAKIFYPDLNFYEVDALKLADYFTKLKFEVIYSFNAFFSFSQQLESLIAMRQVAAKKGKLLLFDYSSPAAYSRENLFYDRYLEEPKIFSPINLQEIAGMLTQSGWQLEKIEDLSKQYQKWYQELIAKMDAQRGELIQQFGDETFADLYDGYCRLLALIESGVLGGVVVLASRAD